MRPKMESLLQKLNEIEKKALEKLRIKQDQIIKGTDNPPVDNTAQMH